MTTRRPRSAAEVAPAAFPALMLTVFFIVPFGIMIAVSFFQVIVIPPMSTTSVVGMKFGTER